jgi:hypothetical protein
MEGDDILLSPLPVLKRSILSFPSSSSGGSPSKRGPESLEY